MATPPWHDLARRQQGMIARRQLRRIGVDWGRVRNHLAAGRWAERSSQVISTFTGPLTPVTTQWLGVLHAGPPSLIGGLTAAERHGLRHWEREAVTVLVDKDRDLEPVPGITFVRTRRSLAEMRDDDSIMPVCKIEPAVLLFAGYVRSRATALGVIAAVIQQRITTPQRLRDWTATMQPLRRARVFRIAIDDFALGAQSWSESRFGRLCRKFQLEPPRRQTRRRGPDGHLYCTDCEWDLADGRTLVLEIDGAFHMEASHWERDIARTRELVTPTCFVLRCTTSELTTHPAAVMRDLRRWGVPRSRP